MKHTQIETLACCRSSHQRSTGTLMPAACGAATALACESTTSQLHAEHAQLTGHVQIQFLRGGGTLYLQRAEEEPPLFIESMR